MNNYGGGAPETASKFAHPPREQKPYEPRHKEGYIGVITKLRNTKRSGRNVKKVYKPDPIGYKPFINPFLTTHYDYSSEEDENIPKMPKRSRADVAKLEAEYNRTQERKMRDEEEAVRRREAEKSRARSRKNLEEAMDARAKVKEEAPRERSRGSGSRDRDRVSSRDDRDSGRRDRDRESSRRDRDSGRDSGRDRGSSRSGRDRSRDRDRGDRQSYSRR